MRETLNVLTFADSSTNTKTDRNRQKKKEPIYISYVMCLMTHAKCNVLGVMCHMSHVTSH